MLDTLTSRNHVDFKQRYQSTYGFLLQEKKKHLVLITRVDGGEVRFVDLDKSEFYAYQDSDHTFEFIQVTRGWFNTSKGLYYLARVPHKQWHRGISDGNTESYELTDKGCVRRTIDLKILTEIFEKSVGADNAAAQFLEGKRHGFALSKHFALTQQSMYFDNVVVGAVAVNGNDIRITLDTSIVQQEISDAVRRGQFRNISIIVKGI